MTANSKIEWTDHTASPWHGCSKVSEGCRHCYADALSKRNPDTLGVWGDAGVRVKSKSFVKNLRKWNREAERAGTTVTVFPSLCDPFEDRPELVPWRNEMFAVADECPHVTLLLLTKRPENVLRMWPPHHRTTLDICGMENVGRHNVWLGTSVEDQQRADERIPHLLNCRDLSPVLFLSAEPLLGPIDMLNLRIGTYRHEPHYGSALHGVDTTTTPPTHDHTHHVDWVIVGGESGPHARPFTLGHGKDIVRQCQAAGVPVFVKQVGSNPVNREGVPCQHVTDSKGGNPDEWPEVLRVRQFPEA